MPGWKHASCRWCLLTVDTETASIIRRISDWHFVMGDNGCCPVSSQCQPSVVAVSIAPADICARVCDQMRAPSLSLDNTPGGLVGDQGGRRRLTSHPSHAHASRRPAGPDPDDMLLDIGPDDLPPSPTSTAAVPIMDPMQWSGSLHGPPGTPPL